MGWWSFDVMGGDDPLDEDVFLREACGMDDAEPVCSAEVLETKHDALLRILRQAHEANDGSAAAQVEVVALWLVKSGWKGARQGQALFDFVSQHVYNKKDFWLANDHNEFVRDAAEQKVPDFQRAQHGLQDLLQLASRFNSSAEAKEVPVAVLESPDKLVSGVRAFQQVSFSGASFDAEDVLRKEIGLKNEQRNAPIPKETLERLQAQLVQDRQGCDCALHVLAVRMMAVGARMSGDTKNAVLRAIERDEPWEDQRKPERDEVMRNFAAAVRDYDASQPVIIKSKGLFETLAEKEKQRTQE